MPSMLIACASGTRSRPRSRARPGGSTRLPVISSDGAIASGHRDRDQPGNGASANSIQRIQLEHPDHRVERVEQLEVLGHERERIDDRGDEQPELDAGRHRELTSRYGRSAPRARCRTRAPYDASTSTVSGISRTWGRRTRRRPATTQRPRRRTRSGSRARAGASRRRPGSTMRGNHTLEIRSELSTALSVARRAPARRTSTSPGPRPRRPGTGTPESDGTFASRPRKTLNTDREQDRLQHRPARPDRRTACSGSRRHAARGSRRARGSARARLRSARLTRCRRHRPP